MKIVIKNNQISLIKKELKSLYNDKYKIVSCVFIIISFMSFFDIVKTDNNIINPLIYGILILIYCIYRIISNNRMVDNMLNILNETNVFELLFDNSKLTIIDVSRNTESSIMYVNITKILYKSYFIAIITDDKRMHIIPRNDEVKKCFLDLGKNIAK